MRKGRWRDVDAESVPRVAPDEPTLEITVRELSGQATTLTAGAQWSVKQLKLAFLVETDRPREMASQLTLTLSSQPLDDAAKLATLDMPSGVALHAAVAEKQRPTGSPPAFRELWMSAFFGDTVELRKKLATVDPDRVQQAVNQRGFGNATCHPWPGQMCPPSTCEDVHWFVPGFNKFCMPGWLCVPLWWCWCCFDNHTPLHVAAGRGNARTAQLLMEYGADPSATVACCVSARGMAFCNCHPQTFYKLCSVQPRPMSRWEEGP